MANTPSEVMTSNMVMLVPLPPGRLVVERELKRETEGQIERKQKKGSKNENNTFRFKN